MLGTWETGDWNIAHNPAAWEMMFNELPHDNIGLEWEPCHQLFDLIDPMPQLIDWMPKIFHVHGKDATVLGMWSASTASTARSRSPSTARRASATPTGPT